MTDLPAGLGSEAIDDLIWQSRAIREAVHEQILRMRHDRRAWERQLAGLSQHVRLTNSQRQSLRWPR